MKRIYLDTASATPLDRRVWRSMKQELKKNYANPSSIHWSGQQARNNLETYRSRAASLLGLKSQQIVFTGGGTESNNLAILGVARGYEKKFGQPGHIITSVIEHHSVLSVLKYLESTGWEVTYLSVDNSGHIDVLDLEKVLKENTALVSLAYVNNEIGVINPLRAIGQILKNYKSDREYPYFHTDACQAGRFFDLKLQGLMVDIMTLNGSKIYGPKGVGLVACRGLVNIEPVIFGGGQEGGKRSGTENVSAVAGLVKALELCELYRHKETVKLKVLQDYFLSEIHHQIPDVVVNGDLKKRSPANINLSFPETEAEFLVILLDSRGVEVSAGSACSSNSKDTSHVLRAIGSLKGGGVRFSLGRETTKRDLKKVVKILSEILPVAKKSL